ncbi:MAG: tRNA (adenosine(37)-N6)-threonylcarbamoyltransferase complex dimerization subunit type 1 TsaB [Chitinophagales bacterium]|nr:MAG: tRNA (adenosine(37)-N6)-threonylcarbamoyltransferase complex dimerization subunit type 1 TsaB [Chitinophagales bacterium]
MIRILNIETATEVCSVCISENQHPVAWTDIKEPNSHSTSLTPAIEQLFSKTGKNLRDLHAVAFSSGPGSFTGLRIGAATALGICYAMNLPLIAVPTFLPMTQAAITETGNKEALYCPLIASVKNEVFCALYNSALQEIEPPSARDQSLDSFQPYLRKHIIFLFGNGLQKVKESVTSNNYRFIQLSNSAYYMPSFSFQYFQLEKFTNLHELRIEYLKNFVPKKN